MATGYCEECEDYTEFYTYIDLGVKGKLKCRDCEAEYNPNAVVKLKEVEKEVKEVQEEIK